MKILCLHGFRHNSVLLQKSMSALVHKYKKLDIHFDFVDSPINYVCVDKTEESMNYRQWWSATKDSVTKLEKYDTVENSIDFLLSKWNQEKYDGILSFSQGSILAQIFAYRIQNNLLNTYAPKFVILCSTFEITDLVEKKVYEKKLEYPCLVMYGEKDTFVSDDLTLRVVENLSNYRLLKHKGGHYVSTTRDTCDALLEFINNYFRFDIYK